MMLRGKERSHESRGSDFAARAGATLPLCRTLESLDCRVFLHLFAADGTRVLVAMVFLDCGDAGRRANLKNAASVDWADFLFFGDADVFAVGAADARDGRRQAMVAFARPLRSKRRRQDATGGTL